MLIVSTLTRCRYESSTWPNAWPSRRLVPASIRISAIEMTAATLTARLRQKFCQALLKAKSSCRMSFIVCPIAIVADDLAMLDRNHTPVRQVYDLPVVRGHHDCHASRVDVQEDLHDLPRPRRVQVAGRLVGDEEAWPVNERARDRHPLLLAAGQLVGVAAVHPRPPHPLQPRPRLPFAHAPRFA